MQRTEPAGLARPESTPRAAWRLPTPAANRRLYLTVGALLAIVGVILTFVLGLRLAATPSGDVAVLVAARDIQSRTAITADDLTVAHFPAGLVPDRHLSAVADALGSYVVVSVPRGQPLTGNLVAKSPDVIDQPGQAYLPIPPGWVAVSLPTSDQMGVGGFIQPGDYITVLAMVNTSTFANGANRVVTKQVFNNLRVIRVGTVTAQPAAGTRGPATGAIITVITTECDAEYLNWLVANTSLRYVLQSYKDYGPAPTAADPSCPSLTSGTGVGPAQVDNRFGFSKV